MKGIFRIRVENPGSEKSLSDEIAGRSSVILFIGSTNNKKMKIGLEEAEPETEASYVGSGEVTPNTVGYRYNQRLLG